MKFGLSDEQFEYLMTNKDEFISRILAKRKITESGCWEWTGSKGTKKNYIKNQSDGYGNIRVIKGYQLVHRIFWMLTKNPKLRSNGKIVMHKCDNPPCFNPDHLIEGTHKDNSQDMHSKNRWTANPNRGDRCATSKLSKTDVSKIRSLIKSGMSQRPIAKMFGVDQTTISKINRGETWNL